ncbi:putative quinol monooxygenase [Kordiimonas aquimaris]|uniref:putative quinol monooxygenase n=1 Tax=Kordiimonas aquimaris TaxID=707591 RepID=UPI0021D320DA|nr:antibiotic biosynthesis monooxygenase family protein [Kordiimonas aquimaris]
MHGVIVKITAKHEKRDELAAILQAGTRNLPGCISFVIAKDMFEPELLWITEVWENKQAHEASVTSQAVRDNIAKARKIMENMSIVTATEPYCI